MFSAYSWSQFGLFILVLVLLYYLTVGLLYYRTEIRSLLISGGKACRPTRAGNAVGMLVPPALVRPTSAFAPDALATGVSTAEQAAAPTEGSATGAAHNLPPVAEPVVDGGLLAATATATGLDEGHGEAPLPAARSASPEAPEPEETAPEAADQVDERLVALVRQPAPTEGEEEQQPVLPTRKPGPVLVEPLASFEEPVASLLDIIPAEPAPLVAAESVSEYIARLQAGQNPPLPEGMAGSCLAEQMARHLDQYQAELAILFAEGEG